MEPLNDPLLILWRSFGDWGFKLVILGVVGEVLAAVADFVAEKFWKVWHEKSKRKLRFIELVAGGILIAGLAMEFRGHKRETQILDSYNAKSYLQAEQAERDAGDSKFLAARIGTTNVWLVASNLAFAKEIIELENGVVATQLQLAKANERTALTESNNIVLRKEVAELDLQLLQTSSNLTKIDPLNLPIVWATAEVSFLLPGTNSLSRWQFPKSDVESQLRKMFVRFVFKDPDMDAFPIELDCDRIDITPTPPSLGGFIVRLSFKSNTLGGEWRMNGLSEKWRNFSAKTFDEIKEAEISMIGLSDKSEIRWGVCWVTLNSTIERNFSIDSPSSQDKIILHPIRKNSDAPIK